MAAQYSSEAEVMDALAIKSWRNLSKDKVIQFAAMMPRMDKELALQVIGQLPEFTRVVGQVLASMEKAYEGALTSNDASMTQAHELRLEALRVYKSRLRQELTSEERMTVLDGVRALTEQAAATDAANKKFLKQLFREKALWATTGILSVLVFVGARVVLQSGSGGGLRGLKA